jgi:hypothetical protein
MTGFAVDTESLIDVANSLTTLRGVLNSISTGYVSSSDADIGGQAVGQELATFNSQWMYGVTEISGEVENMTLALFSAAAHYDHTEQQVVDRSHGTPTGSGPVVGKVHGGARAHPHEKPKHDKPKDHKLSGTGTTTVGGPRMPITGRGTGTGTTTIGRGGDGQHHHNKDSGSGTTTIGPGGTTTTVTTGPGRGYGTTTIGPRTDGGAALAPKTCTVHSEMLTSHQATFVSTLSALTGLSPRVVGAWCLSEESGANAAARQADGNNNWLNIQTGADPSAWRDPATAAQQTAKFLQGQWGGASHSIQGIVGSAGGSAAQQLATISGSDWAADHFDGGSLLRETYGQLSGMTVSEH